MLVIWALFIEAEYDLVDNPIDISVVVDLATRLPDLMWAAGEQRVPHVRHQFDERHKIKPRERRKRSKVKA